MARLNQKKCQQGMDGMNLEYVLGLQGAEHLYLPEEVLKNNDGNTVVSISCVGGKIKAYVNAVHSIRPNNIQPFGIVDTIKLELVKSEVVDFMRGYLKKHLRHKYSDEYIDNIKVMQLECNLTIPCVKGATPSDVISLFDKALDKTVLFRKAKARYKKTNTGCQYSKSKEYRLKIYDKSEEQHAKGNLSVERNLLRVEVDFLSRSLNRMYGEKRTLGDILTKQAVVTLCREYKCVLEEIINKHIIPFLNECVKLLFESMTYSETGKEVCETIARHRDYIPDTEVLRKALQQYYTDFKKSPDNSKQMICYYRKKQLGLPEGVLQTIKAFHKSAG